ncbi:restriction endonuclease subunit S [Rhizobium ruizarguesonis]
MKAGWETKPLGQCAVFIDYRGKTPPKVESGIRLITAKNVKMGFVQSEPMEFVDPAAYDAWMSRGIPENGDVLFTTEAPLGNVAQLEVQERVVIGQRLITFKTDRQHVDPTFLKYALLSPQVQSEVHSRATGATVQGIKASLLKGISIPLPKLEEQQRIVGKLDEACEGLDRARANAEANLKNARELLALQIEHELAVASRRTELATIGDICSRFEYGTSSKSEAQGRVPVLRMGNLQAGEIDWEDLTYTNDDRDIEKLSLKELDVLFNRTNSLEHVGKTAIYRGEQPAIFAGYLIRLHYRPELIDPEFLTLFLNSRGAREYGRSIAGKSVNQANISATRLREYRIPLPSLDEQESIVRRIALLRGPIETMKSFYKNKLKDIADLRQSFMHKVFAGELT